MKIGVLLSGSGVYDGSEIHEAVCTMLAIAQAGGEYVCMAPDKPQHHVINHVTGEEMQESRNVLVESARIARGEVISLENVEVNELDALIIPGGFGAAKNLNQWALAGPDGLIDASVTKLINAVHASGKPIGALCMGPTVLAQALTSTGLKPKVTVGTAEGESPYDIAGISGGMEALGATVEFKSINEICVDRELKLVTAPCYMMKASIDEVYANAKLVVNQVVELAV